MRFSRSLISSMVFTRLVVLGQQQLGQEGLDGEAHRFGLQQRDMVPRLVRAPEGASRCEEVQDTAPAARRRGVAVQHRRVQRAPDGAAAVLGREGDEELGAGCYALI